MTVTLDDDVANALQVLQRERVLGRPLPLYAVSPKSNGSTPCNQVRPRATVSGTIRRRS
jgi:hypothetical protein